jgi:hypothetical protein
MILACRIAYLVRYLPSEEGPREGLDAPFSRGLVLESVRPREARGPREGSCVEGGTKPAGSFPQRVDPLTGCAGGR